jgi:hypothetical protein
LDIKQVFEERKDRKKVETKVILAIIFPTTNCVKICLLEKKGDAEGSGFARQRRAVRVAPSALQKKV